MSLQPDFIVVGAGSAGCICAARLVELQAGSVTLIEAGPSDRHPLVRMPFGLVWLMGSKNRDWRYSTTPQAALNDRQISVPRGRMVGGSGSINSMVWFRGRRDDFDQWNVPGWSWADVEPHFKAVEARLRPTPLASAHPLTNALGTMFAANEQTAPTPERESAGIFSFNLHKARRHSSADGFLRGGKVDLVTDQIVDRLEFKSSKAVAVVFGDGSKLRANKGIILSAGSIGSPAILLRSGIGPKSDLAKLGIDLVQDADNIGQNLHDHPTVGLHFSGNAGYGFSLRQSPNMALAPFRYIFGGTGPFASPTVEGGAFFNARGNVSTPDVQSHFMPFHVGHKGSRFSAGQGYFADVTLCRPQSRGDLRLAHKDPTAAPLINPRLLWDQNDFETLLFGIKRLRRLLDATDFGSMRGVEVFPGSEVQSNEQLAEVIRARTATAYHPVGTVTMGGVAAPISPDLSVNGVEGLWVADASVMPSITSANTNAPSMMIGHKAAELIAKEVA